jgi:hypothetical protein
VHRALYATLEDLIMEHADARTHVEEGVRDYAQLGQTLEHQTGGAGRSPAPIRGKVFLSTRGREVAISGLTVAAGHGVNGVGDVIAARSYLGACPK